jgi:hypothetical protein
MTSSRVSEEVALIRGRYSDLDFRDCDLWGRLQAYPIPSAWGVEAAEVAFRVPENPLGEQPYGFWVRPALQLPGGGSPSNSSGPVETGFGSGWQQFSWAPEAWAPNPDIRKGTTMLDFVRSFTQRLCEVN